MATERHLTTMLIPILIMIGLLLVVLGWTWNYLVPSSAYWGAEEAREYTKAQVELHAMEDAHAHDKNHDENMAAARERFNNIHAQLEQARTSQNRASSFFIAAGVLCLAAGIGTHLATRQAG
jgi:ABC-type nickel/cobalt efflux system permease component RcnA